MRRQQSGHVLQHTATDVLVKLGAFAESLGYRDAAETCNQLVKYGNQVVKYGKMIESWKVPQTLTNSYKTLAKICWC